MVITSPYPNRTDLWLLVRSLLDLGAQLGWLSPAAILGIPSLVSFVGFPFFLFFVDFYFLILQSTASIAEVLNLWVPNDPFIEVVQDQQKAQIFML